MILEPVVVTASMTLLHHLIYLEEIPTVRLFRLPT